MSWKFRLERDGMARELMQGVNSRVVFGAQVMLSRVEIAPHTTSKLHSHPEEQWGLLLEGSCIRIQGDEELPMAPGDCWLTPGGVPHAIRTGDDPAVILDIFAPPRAAYRQAGSGYGEEG